MKQKIHGIKDLKISVKAGIWETTFDYSFDTYQLQERKHLNFSFILSLRNHGFLCQLIK